MVFAHALPLELEPAGERLDYGLRTPVVRRAEVGGFLEQPPWMV